MKNEICLFRFKNVLNNFKIGNYIIIFISIWDVLNLYLLKIFIGF